MTDHEKTEKALRKVLAQIDAAERQWLSLPADVREKNQSLSRFFAAKPAAVEKDPDA